MADAVRESIFFKWFGLLALLAAAGSRGGQNRGEGSLLGEFGDLIGGNH